jgi:hypothetical protein
MIAIENVRWKDTEVVRAQEQSAALRWSTARQLAGKTPYDLFFATGDPQSAGGGTNRATGRMSEHIESGDFANHSKLVL